jgi:hypothetical protein
MQKLVFLRYLRGEISVFYFDFSRYFISFHVFLVSLPIQYGYTTATNTK